MYFTIIAIITSLIPIISFLFYISAKFAKLELKVDTMWEFQIRRAITEVVSSGIGTKNSPLRFTDAALSKLDPIKDRLINYHIKSKTRKLSDAEELLELEKEFGDELVEYICLPYSLSHGACLMIALGVARNENPLNIDFQPRHKKSR